MRFLIAILLSLTVLVFGMTLELRADQSSPNRVVL